MKLFIVACLVAVAAAGRLENTYLPPSSAGGAGGSGKLLAAPSASGHASAAQSAEAGSQTLRFDNENDGNGHYSYAFETDNHIHAEEKGELKNEGSENEAASVQGSYSYTGADGVVYTVTYIADENGFQPSGAHLPTPPPIPEAILRSLELNAAEEAAALKAGGGVAGANAPSKGYLAPAPAQPSFSPQSGYKY